MDETVFAQVEDANRDFAALVARIRPEVAAEPHLAGDWSAQQIVAHIVAWLEEGVNIFTIVREDGIFPAPYDDDAFNAAAVARFQDMSWQELQRALAQSQEAFVQIAKTLSAPVWQDKRTLNWFIASTSEHYNEHRAALEEAAARSA